MLNVLIGQADRPNRIKNEGKDEKYHSDFARYCVFAGYNHQHQKFIEQTRLNKQFYKGEQWVNKEDLEAFFKDDTGQERNRIKVVKNLIRPMIEQYRGNAIRMKIKARVESISPRAINRREEKLKEMNFFSDVANKLEQGGATGIADHLRSKMPIGKNKEETRQIFENVYVDDFVDAMNALVLYITNENRMEAKQVKTAENLALSGVIAIETYESAGNQMFKTIESEDYFWDRSAREYDHSDGEFKGVINYLSPTEIFERWDKISDTQRIAIENYSKEYIHQMYEGTTQNISQSGKVPVFRVFWKDSEKYDYGYVMDEFGYPLLTKIDFTEPGEEKPRYTSKDVIEPPTEKAKKLLKGKKTRPMYIDVLRFCEIIPKEFLSVSEYSKNGTVDVALDFGISEYQEVENEKPASVKFPIKSYCWGYVDGEVMSPIDDVINPQRFINRLLSVAENQINNSRGSGMVYDKDLVDSQEKEDELLRNANQSKPIGLSAKGRGIQNAIGQYDGTIKQGTMVMFEIVNVMNSYIQQITGVNEALKGESTGSEQLVGVTQLLLQRGSLMQEPFYNAIGEVFMQCYQSMLTFGKKVYADNERQLAIAVGDKWAKTIRISKDMMAEDFRSFVFRENGEEVLINAGNQQLMTFLQIGIIDKKRFADLYNRSTPEQISRALRESVMEQQEMARMSQEDKEKKGAQMQQAIAQQNENQISMSKIAEQKASDELEKNRQHDIDKILTQGMVKKSIQHEKLKGELAKQNNEPIKE